MAQFLDQVRFIEVIGSVPTTAAALSWHQKSGVHFFIAELPWAEAMLAGLRAIPEATRPRLVIVGPEESYFFERGAVEPILFSVDNFVPSRQGALKGLAPTMPSLQDKPAVQPIDFWDKIATGLHPIPDEGRLLASPYSELIYVRTEGGIKRLKRTDLLVIEAQKDYLSFTARSATYRVLRSLKSVEARLDPSIHCRVHRSYIVLIEAIHTIDQDQVWVDGLQTPIPIGPNYRKELLSRLEII